MAAFAYIRVSTDGQTTDNQRKVIEDAGFAVQEFFAEEGVSGSTKAAERPAFARLLEVAKAGDTIIVTMVDRLGRSTSDVLNVVEDLKARSIKLRVMQLDGMDITSPAGKLLMTMMAALAEMERNILIERTVAGLERTKAQGTKLGPPLTIEPEVLRNMVMHKPSMTLDKLAQIYGFPRNTIHRNLTTWGNNLDGYEKEWNARKEQYAAV